MQTAKLRVCRNGEIACCDVSGRRYLGKRSWHRRPRAFGRCLSSALGRALSRVRWVGGQPSKRSARVRWVGGEAVQTIGAGCGGDGYVVGGWVSY